MLFLSGQSETGSIIHWHKVKLVPAYQLGYTKHGHGKCNGVAVYNPDLMLGGVITWSEIVELIRTRAATRSLLRST